MRFDIKCPYCDKQQFLCDDSNVVLGPRGETIKFNCVGCNSRIGIKFGLRCLSQSAKIKRERARKFEDNKTKDQAAITALLAQPGCTCQKHTLGWSRVGKNEATRGFIHNGSCSLRWQE